MSTALRGPLWPGASQNRVWMEREDGLLVCSGTAAVGDHSTAELRTRDLRPCHPSDLRILRDLDAGMPLGHFELTMTPDKQFWRYDQGLISDPLEVYRSDQRFGGVVAAPCTFVQYLWEPPTRRLRPQIGDAVGQSPQTEYLWFDATACTPSGERVAAFRMVLRFMKTSSQEYQ